MRIALDTMIFDLIVDQPKIEKSIREKVDAGKLVLIITHVQQDQLKNILDQEKREKVLSLPVECVLTTGAIWGVSKWGHAKFGTGDQNEALRKLSGESGNHGADALIGVTAQNLADAIVTRDTRLRNHLRRESPAFPVWGFEEFIEKIETL